jgi:hypothetical protein
VWIVLREFSFVFQHSRVFEPVPPPKPVARVALAHVVELVRRWLYHWDPQDGGNGRLRTRKTT